MFSLCVLTTVHILLFCRDFQSEYLRCDCHLQWMVQWSKDREVRIRSSTICAVPREVSGKSLKTLKKKDLHCGKIASCNYKATFEIFADIFF